MNVLVTAGGTIEPIDNVRSITNTGTGKLGSLIADEFLSDSAVDHLFYICTKNAVKPQNPNADIVFIKSVSDLENCVRQILNDNEIDIIIHSMAVSDFTVRSVTDMTTLISLLNDFILKNEVDMIDNGIDMSDNGTDKIDRDEAEQYLLEGFSKNDLIGKSGKMSSQVKYPLILLDETPKVLPQFREKSPNSIIVGFKLLSGVTKDELLDVAYDLLQTNKCDFVLANDESLITKDKHVAHLLNEHKETISFETKEEIAVGLVEAILKMSKP